MNDQTDTINHKGTGNEIGSDVGSSDKTADTPPASTTKPRSGEVTADENKRFLAEIVALHAISKASDEIAESIAEAGKGGILIVNEMDFASDEIFYLDIRQKLDTLLKISEEALKKCLKFAQTEEKHAVKGPEEELLEIAPLAAIPAITMGVAGVSGLLSSIGDVVGLFRSDYELKGQTLTTPEDIYLQAIVADRLRKLNRVVYLIDFQAIKESSLIRDLNKLLNQKLTMLVSADAIKGTRIDVQTELATALETHVANLRGKLVESLLKADEQVITNLRSEIDQKTRYLKECQENRMPDSQITGLETYLATLRSKLAEELLKDNLSSKEVLDHEVQKIGQKLLENEKASADKKLTEAEVNALTDQKKQYQTALADLVASAGYNPKEALKHEIESVNEDLRKIQKDRMSASQITALETHIAGLNGKLVESLSTNDIEALAILNKEIEKSTHRIEEIRKSMKEPQEIVSTCMKANDAIDGFINAITTIPSGGKYPPYMAACVPEYFAEERIKFILKLKLIASGADFIIEKPPFWSTDIRTSYLGGVVVSFILAEKDGRIAASGTIGEVAALDHRIGKEPKEINWQIRPKKEV